MTLDMQRFYELPVPNKRYLHAYKVDGDSILRLSPKGFCNWCGKPLTGRSRFFCPKSVRYAGTAWEKIDYWCTLEFTMWWTVGNSKFKRVIYIRDNFTCQICGLRPRIKNEHKLDIPDLSLLAIDHIYPVARGGETKIENLQVLCRKCNSKKRDRVPTEIQRLVGQGVMELNI